MNGGKNQNKIPQYHLPFLNRRIEHVSQAASPHLRTIDMHNARKPSKKKKGNKKL